MRFPEAVFEIIEDKRCPFYGVGDRFRLSGKALLLDHTPEKTFISTTVIKLPPGKSTCRIIIEDISEILIKYKSVDNLPGHMFHCSGCTGKIRLEYKKREKPLSVPMAIRQKVDMDVLQSFLGNFSFFKVLDENLIKDFVPFLKLRQFEPDEIIIRKGKLGKYLYIIVSGKVEVLGQDGISIAFMGKGEVFGEMSLFSGDPATATIRVVEPTKVLSMSDNDFKNLLNKSSSLQMYFIRLLSRRLAEINGLRSEEFGSGFVGELSEIPPAELFQIFNVNQKTGIVTLNLAKGISEIIFRDGKLIRAGYNGKEGREAFFEVLKEQEGRFKFTQGLPPKEAEADEIGDLTWLLMDGTRRLDEERKS